jgi:hypothetical protein
MWVVRNDCTKEPSGRYTVSDSVGEAAEVGVQVDDRWSADLGVPVNCLGEADDLGAFVGWSVREVLKLKTRGV